VREQFKRGADFIEIGSHYNTEEVAAAIEEAHALGLKITVDAETSYIPSAVEAEIDMIERPLPRTDEAIQMWGISRTCTWLFVTVKSSYSMGRS